MNMNQRSPNNKAVRKERTGWRDESVSNWHRKLGYDCPATDLDFLLIEYDTATPKALVELKNEHYHHKNLNKATFDAIKNLADMARLPAFVVVYADDKSWWRVSPLNDEGRKWLEPKTTLSEKEYGAFLYKLRGRIIPKDIEDLLNG